MATILGWLYFWPRASRSERFFVHHHPHLGKSEGFENVVAGARFHRFNRGFNRAEGSHDHDGQRRILLLGGLQKLEPADAGKFEIGEHEVNRF